MEVGWLFRRWLDGGRFVEWRRGGGVHVHTYRNVYKVAGLKRSKKALLLLPPTNRLITNEHTEYVGSWVAGDQQVGVGWWNTEHYPGTATYYLLLPT